MKSISYFSTNEPLKKILKDEFNFFSCSEESDVHSFELPPGTVCIIDAFFSKDGGIVFSNKLQERYSNIVVLLAVSGEINNEIVKKAVSIGKVYRIFSVCWNESRIKRVISDAFSYSSEIRKNLFLLDEERERQQKLISTQLALKNEEFLNLKSLMYADQIVSYAKSSIESFNQILSAVGSGDKDNNLLDSIRVKICRLIPLDAIGICYRPKRTSSIDDLNISLSYSKIIEKENKLKKLSRKFYHITRKKIKPNKANIVDNNFVLSCDVFNDEEISSSLVIPLVHQGKYLGILILFRFGDYKFKKREQLIVEHFSEAGNIVVRGFRNFEYFEKTKQEWESTFDAILDPVALVDKDYNLIRVNKAYGNFTSLKLREIVGCKCYKIFAARLEPCEGCPMESAVQDREAKSCEELKIGKRFYSAWGYPVENYQREIKSIVMFYRDITRESFLRTQLMDADKKAEIGILAGSVAHEINNPLGGIIAFAQVMMKELKTDGKDKEQFYKDIEEIYTAGVRCKKIVEGLLNFSRLSKMEESVDINLKEVLRTAISLVDYNARLYNISFDTTLNNNVPPIFGNYNQILQVLLAILSRNLCDVESLLRVEDRRIGISLSLKESKVHIKFKNSGKAISSDEIEKIFNPDQFMEDDFLVDKKNIAGGLSVTYEIIQSHSGSIKVGSFGGENEYNLYFPVSHTEKNFNIHEFRIQGD